MKIRLQKKLILRVNQYHQINKREVQPSEGVEEKIPDKMQIVGVQDAEEIPRRGRPKKKVRNPYGRRGKPKEV